MDHFTSPQWVDLVRGVSPGDVRDAMEQHLREGCQECLDTYGVWRGIVAVAEEDRLSVPPEDALRAAKASWRARPDLRRHHDAKIEKPSWLSAITATLVFDSLDQAVAVGVRASAMASRHLLYAASPLAIDLHLDVGSEPGTFLLAGQIADSTQPDKPLSRATLTLFSGDVDLLTFQANQYGEFHCQFEREHDMRLLLALEGRGVISIPLDTLFEPLNGALKNGHDE